MLSIRYLRVSIRAYYDVPGRAQMDVSAIRAYVIAHGLVTCKLRDQHFAWRWVDVPLMQVSDRTGPVFTSIGGQTGRACCYFALASLARSPFILFATRLGFIFVVYCVQELYQTSVLSYARPGDHLVEGYDWYGCTRVRASGLPDS